MTQRIYTDTVSAGRTVCDASIMVRVCVLVDVWPDTRDEPGVLELIEVNMFWPDGHDVQETLRRQWYHDGTEYRLVADTLYRGRFEYA